MITVDIQKQLKSKQGRFELQISESINDGEFVCMQGPSGAGKTSVLRLISGLLSPDRGSISQDSDIWYDGARKVHLAPKNRKIGYVFQDLALFPNLSVRQHLEFSRTNKSNNSIIDELLEMLELSELSSRKPDTLSGGQKQRIALARAVVNEPKLLLMDEPLSALDRSMRHKIQKYILEIHQRFKLTSVLVTHDISEVLKMGSLLWIMEQGKIVSKGIPQDIITKSKRGGEFQFSGEVISIERQDIIYIIRLLIGNDIVKVVADESEVQSLRPGDLVLATSKAFNPIIRKI